MLLLRSCPICLCGLDRGNRDPQLHRLCSHCSANLDPAPATSVAGVDQCIAVWTYDEASAPLLSAAKSAGGKALFQHLADPLAKKLLPFRQKSSVITWVPPSPRGRRRRGFDQGRTIAQAVAHRLEIPSAPAFSRHGRAQFGESRSARLLGPRLKLRSDWTCRTEQVILLDDVITTGASLATAAELLRELDPAVDVVAGAIAVRL